MREGSLMTLIWFDKVSFVMRNEKGIARGRASASRISFSSINFYRKILCGAQHAACVNMFDSLGDQIIINSYQLACCV